MASPFQLCRRPEINPAGQSKRRRDMNKFIISLAALAAFSTAAAADDNDRVFGSSADYTIEEAGYTMSNSRTDAVAIAEVGNGWLFGSGENLKDPMEVRRFDEKN
jgi:hypothetical protein